MNYVLIGLIALMMVACTVINVTPSGDDKDRPAAVSIQTSTSGNVLGSQNNDNSPKAARGNADSNDSKGGQKAETTSVIPITTTPTIVPK